MRGSVHIIIIIREAQPLVFEGCLKDSVLLLLLFVAVCCALSLMLHSFYGLFCKLGNPTSSPPLYHIYLSLYLYLDNDTAVLEYFYLLCVPPFDG